MDTRTKSWQAQLHTWRQEHTKTIPDLLRRLREDFVRHFPAEEIPGFSLDRYAVGKPDSFCYWLEFKTKE